MVQSSPTTSNVDYTLVVKKFCDLYMKSEQVAALWARNNIDKSLFPTLRPQIRSELRKRGVRFKNAD